MGKEFKWPPLPEIIQADAQADVKKILYQAQVDVIKAEYQAELAVEKARIDAGIESDKRAATANIEREKADWANEYVQAQAVNNAYLDVTKGSLERATSRANFVQVAATAISGAYVAVLGLSFAVGKSNPLPARGIVPTLFLGIAIFLAAIYSSFITEPGDVQVPSSDGTLPGYQRQRRDSFVLWTRETILSRRQSLQAAVISLGIGALLLPLPYLAVSNTFAIIIAGVGLLLVLFLPRIISRWLGEAPEIKGAFRPPNSDKYTDGRLVG